MWRQAPDVVRSCAISLVLSHVEGPVLPVLSLPKEVTSKDGAQARQHEMLQLLG